MVTLLQYLWCIWYQLLYFWYIWYQLQYLWYQFWFVVGTNFGTYWYHLAGGIGVVEEFDVREREVAHPPV